MNHQLVIDYRAGCYEARCSCGRWSDAPAPSTVCRIRQVYPGIEAGHRRHVEDDLAPADTPAKA